MYNSDRENRYFRAKERIESIKKFYASLISNIAVIIFTGAINYYTNQWQYPWFLWVVFGVSLGTVFRAIKLFGYNSILGKDWEQRKIDEFMREEETRNRWE